MKTDTKPYDTAFKDLAEQEPELLLRLVGALPPGATVKVLSREVSAPMLATDQPYEITSPSEHFIAHLEEQTRWEAELPERVAAYQAILWANHRLPVNTYVLLLTPRGLPEAASLSCTIAAGGLTLLSQFTLVRVWEISAAEALATGNANLLPFISLMDGGQAELEQSARALGQVADEDRKLRLAAHFVVVGGLRYNKDYIYDLLGRLSMVPIQAYRESSVYQFILSEGREEGLEKGLEKGREEGKHETLTKMLQRLAQQRFPGVELADEAAGIHDLAALENLCFNLDALPDETALHAQLKALAANGQTNGHTDQAVH